VLAAAHRARQVAADIAPWQAVRALAALMLVTSLAVPPGAPAPALRHLLQAIAGTDPL
jgi:hypothetical protein